MTVKKWRVCRLCGLDERVAGSWVDKRNPVYTETKVIYANIERLEAHALCLIMEQKRGEGWNLGRGNNNGRNNTKKSIK